MGGAERKYWQWSFEAFPQIALICFVNERNWILRKESPVYPDSKRQIAGFEGAANLRSCDGYGFSGNAPQQASDLS